MDGDRQVVGRIERLLESARIPGCSLALVSGKGTVWSEGFGYADVTSRRPATASTVYHLFSGTKLFTAAAVLKLAEDGVLDLNAKVTNYLPRVVSMEGITVRDLLCHASGLRETVRGFLAVYFPGDKPPTTAQALAGYDLRSNRPPGGKAEYRNVNYAILGEIVSRVSGAPYREFVRRRVLEPLSSDAGFEVTDFDSRFLATGYIARCDPTRALLRWVDPPTARRIYRGRAGIGLMALADYNLATSAAGGLIGSVGSFVPFIQSQLNDGRPLLSKASLRNMHTLAAAGKAGVTSREGVGLGWKIGVAGGRRFLNHEGAGAGFTSELRIYPDSGLGLVVLMNRSSMGRTIRVAHAICELMSVNAPPRPTAAA
jgi:CubicO group peptidase (beta-lactamase class C family)